MCAYLLVCVSTAYMQVPVEPEEDCKSPGAGVIRTVDYLMRVLEIELQSSEEQQALLSLLGFQWLC